MDALRQSIEGLKQGGPFEDGVKVGPLIHEAAVNKVTNYLKVIIIIIVDTFFCDFGLKYSFHVLIFAICRQKW